MKKLLKIALTALMAITMVTVNVSAEGEQGPVKFDKIVYHGNGATSVNSTNEFIFNNVNTDERNYVQTSDIVIEEDVTTSFIAADNHFINNKLPGTMFVGWGTAQDSTTAVITPAEISQGLSIKLDEKEGLIPRDDGALHLYAVWSGVLNVAFKNIDSSYKDSNPNIANLTVSLGDVNGGKTFKIQDATKSVNANSAPDKFGGWFYKTGTGENTVWHELPKEKIDNVDYYIINEDIYNTFAKSGNTYTGGTLELYAKWYYTINYQLNVPSGSDYKGINYSLPTDYTPVEKYSKYNAETNTYTVNYQRHDVNYATIGDTLATKGSGETPETLAYDSSWHVFPQLGSDKLGKYFTTNEDKSKNWYKNDGIDPVFDIDENNIRIEGTKDYYHFNYWAYKGYKFSEFVSNKQSFSDEIVKIVDAAHDGPEVTLVAQWEKFVEVKYNFVDKEIHDKTGTIVRTDGTPYPNYTRVLESVKQSEHKLKDLNGTLGYSFKEWFSNSTLTNAVTHIVPTSIKNFFAKFTYDVIYDANVYNSNGQAISTGGKFPTGDGYTTTDGGTNYYVHNDGQNPDQVLNNDNTMLTKKDFVFMKESDLSIKHNPTRKGYTLLGWQDLSGKVYSLNDLPKVTDLPANSSGKHILTAVWSAETYTITLNANDPLVKNCDQSHTHTKSCYKLDDSKDGSNANKVVMPSIYKTSTKDNAEMSVQDYIYAVTKTYDTDLDIDSLVKPTRPGYTFEGWFTEASGGTKITNANDGNDLLSTDRTLYAHWTPNKYSIVFDINKPHAAAVITSGKGTMSDQTNVPYNESVAIKANTYGIDGYKFIGWATKPDGNVVYGVEATPSTTDNNIAKYSSLTNTYTLYAKWTPIKYTVVFDMGVNDVSASIPSSYTQVSLNSGMNSSTPNKKYTTNSKLSYDDTIDTPLPTRTGYQFAGWYDGTTLVSDIKNLTKTNDGTVTLVAHWTQNTYTIKAVLNGGSYSTTPTNWSKDSDNNYYITAYYDATGNYTLHTPSRTGYVFNGWYKDSATSYEVDLDSSTDGTQVKNTTTVQNGVTVYTAQWTPIKYGLTFDGNKGTGSTAVSLTIDGSSVGTNGVYTITDAAYDTRYQQPIASRNGYTFDGWYYCNNTAHSNCKGDVLLPADQDVLNIFDANGKSRTYYAHWTANTYTVVFHDNKPANSEATLSGSMTAQTIRFDEETTLNALGFDLKGYTFKGWSITSTGSAVYDYDSATTIPNKIKVDNSNFASTSTVIDLYAVWSMNDFDVRLYLNDHRNNIIEATEATGIPSEGWTWDATAKEYYKNDINYENTVSLPVLTRDGYTFDGWYTALVGGTRVDATAAADGTVTPIVKPLNMYSAVKDSTVRLYAHWTPVKFTVNFNLNRPTKVQEAANVTISNISLLTNLVKDTDYVKYHYVETFDVNTYILPTLTLNGYKFDGWYTAGTGENPAVGGTVVTNLTNLAYNSSTHQVAETVELYAHWTKVDYKVVLDLNDISASVNPSITAHSSWGTNGTGYTVSGNQYTINATYDQYYALVAPTMTGYTFKGWFTDPVAGTQLTLSTNKTTSDSLTTVNHKFTDQGTAVECLVNQTSVDKEVVRYYAHWEANTIVVKRHNALENTHGTTDTCPTTSVVYDSFVQPITVPTKEGYKFLGYYDKPQSNEAVNITPLATQYFDAEGNYSITNSTTWTVATTPFDLYAWWSYDVRIHSNGGVIYYNTNSTSAPSTLAGFNGNLAENEVIQIKDIKLFGGNLDGVSGASRGQIGLNFNKNTSAITTYSAGNPYALAVRTTLAKDTVVVNGNNGNTISVKYVGLYKEGYSLAGFVKAANLNKADANGVLLDGQTVDYTVDAVLNGVGVNYSDFDLYAVWTENTYQVVFHNTNVDTGVTEEKTQTLKYTELSTLNSITFENVKDTSKVLTGWNTTEGTTYNLTHSITKLTNKFNGVIHLYSVWTDGYAVVYYPTYMTTNENPELGWSTTTGGAKVYNSEFPTNVTNNNVKLVEKLGTGTINGLSYLYGNNITRVGYVFEGFYKNPEGTISINRVNDAKFADNTFTVYVKWTEVPEYNVTFNANGGNFGKDAQQQLITTVEKGFVYNVAQDVTNPTRDGYTFLGWTEDAAGNTYAYNTVYASATDTNKFTSTKDNGVLLSNVVSVSNPLYPVKGTRVLYAKWAENKYKITYDVNIPVGSIDNAASANNITNTIDVNKTLDITFANGAKVEYPDADNTPELNGYTFVGWSTVKNDRTTALAANALVDDLYVESVYNTVKNTYNAAQGVDHNNPYEITVYAVWTPKTFKVVFDDNNPVKPADQTKWDGKVVMSDGSNYADKTVVKTFDADIATSDIPVVTRQGYTFDGWMLPDNTVVTEFSDIGLARANYSASDLVLRAKWVANTEFTVTFDKNDDWTDKEYRVLGEMADVEHIVYNAEMTLPTCVFSMKGYTFMGWSIDKNDSVEFADGEKYVVQNIDANANEGGKTLTLYAVWQANNYTIKFDNGTAGETIVATGTMTPITVNFDENKTLPEVGYSRPGYTFLHWETKDEKNEIKTFENLAQIKNLTSIAGSTITFKAIWAANGTTVVQGTDLTAGMQVWVDGQKSVVKADGTIDNSSNAKVITTYTFHETGNYPTGMIVYKVVESADGNKTLVKMADMTNLLTYGGTSIRLTGNKGIRIMTEMTKDNKLALTGTTGIDGYIAVEYGTVMAWTSNLDGKEPTLGFADIGKAAKGYAYNRAAGYDKVFQWSDAQNKEVSQADAIKAVYTNVLTGNWTTAQCAQPFSMRPYVILRPVNAVDTTQDIVVYGGTVVRSIQSVANQALQLTYTSNNVKYWYYGTYGSEYNYFVNSLGGTPRSAAEASRPQN